MNLLKRSLLNAYCYGSLPYRSWWMRRACALGRAPVMIFFYHRVADEHPNDWTCSTALFARQMAWLRERTDVVSLSEAQRRLREGCDRPTSCITFDDGYGDNNDFALPLLVQQRMPCTYFVSLDYVESGRPFPHDVRAGRPLAPNSIDDLRRWSEAGIEIGAHTRNHADCGTLHDPDRLYDEVVMSGRELGAALSRPIRYFAFPYGLHKNMQPLAFEMAREAGYLGVCSAYGGYNFPGDDPFHLQRIHADPEAAPFWNWLTLDPRKLRVPRYDYSRERSVETFASSTLTS